MKLTLGLDFFFFIIKISFISTLWEETQSGELEMIMDPSQLQNAAKKQIYGQKM